MATDPSRDRIDNGSRLWTLATATLALLPLLLQIPGALASAIAVAAVLVTALSWRKPMPALLRLLLAVFVLAAVFSQMGFRFGRDTGCALLAAMIAIKPSETSTLRDARSLIGFALFAPFSAFLLDQGPLTMLLGLLSVFCALVTLQRLANVESDALSSATAPLRTLAAVGKLVAIGLPLALSMFWLFPRLGSPLWGVPERALGRPGLSENMTPGEWLDLMADDTPALRVEFFGARPASQEMYWRGPVLWDFDGRSWTQPSGMRQLPAQPVGRTDSVWDYQIEFEPTDRRQLVALDLPRAAPPGAFLSQDYGLYSAAPLSALTRWRLRSSPPASFQPQLDAAARQRALALPAGYNPRTLALARQWRREAGTDDAAIVRRALDWVKREFGYTLDTPLPGRNSVDEFLFDQKKGYCEHFSSSFVVLMRAAGIPARVVTGFAGGVRNPFGDYWVIRNMDAHAWTEVWFAGRGWVRVDPTAAVAPERIYDTLEDRLGAGADTGALGRLAALGGIGDWMRRGWNDLVLGFNADRQQRLLQPLGMDRLDGGRLGVLFGIFALTALAWMGWLLARGERERDPLLRAWHRLGRRYARLGLERQPHEPALDWAERVARARPQSADTLIPLSRRFAQTRYAGAVGDAALLNDLRRHRP
ncbi:MAG: transglutaminase TgpA family protein [Pseudoxanthomonas sp.]